MDRIRGTFQNLTVLTRVTTVRHRINIRQFSGVKLPKYNPFKLQIFLSSRILIIFIIYHFCTIFFVILNVYRTYTKNLK